MLPFKSTLSLVIVSCGLSAAWLLQPQTNGAVSDHADREQEVAPDRLTALEQRVQSLESILFASRQLNVREARRRLERARQQVVDSRELFNQGVLADAQLQQDRFNVLIAERELELAEAPQRHRELMSGLDLLDAQRRVESARQVLSYSETLNQRGFGSLTQIENARQELELAEAAVRTAEQQLQAAKELDKTPPPVSPEASKPETANDKAR